MGGAPAISSALSDLRGLIIPSRLQPRLHLFEHSWLRLVRGLLRDRLEHGVQSAWRVGSQDLLVPVTESLNALVSLRSLLSSLVQIILASFI